MKRGLLFLVALSLCWSAFGQKSEGARLAARSNVEAYDDEAGIIKSAYRDSPYFLEMTGRWNQKKTDSSIVYSRELDVEKYWKDYRVSLNVRCGRACRVWLNGKAVGYGDDSRHWNEFALDKFLKYGKKNTLAIETLKHPQEALLESADQLEGLNGEPYLLFKGDPNVEDLSLVADYDALSQSGTLSLDVSVFNSKKKGKYYLEVEVWDPKGHTFDRMGRWVVFEKTDNVQVDMSRSWNGVEPWTAETPNLYTAVVRLRNEEMEEEELVGARFGFRRVEVKDGLLLLNGKPLTLKGVTYGLKHTEGLAGRERIKHDLQTMKQNNINAVRTAKYSPMEPYFYQLCDEMGLYVVCDANLLPSSTQQHAVATDKDFIPLFEHRVDNLYGKYKNHPSIVAWSLGESRDNGICMAAAYKRLTYLDKNRPVIFSGAEHSENTDIIALMNPSVQVLRQSLEKTGDRPFIMLASVDDDHFASLDELWSLVETRRNLQGGFVDKWPLNGIKLADLKGLYSPFDVHLSKTTIDDAEFTVYNRNDFLNFSNYILEYTIFTNLRPNITAGDFPMAIAGGGVEAVKLRMPPIELQPGEEIFIRFDLERRKASLEERLVGTVVFPLPYDSQAKRTFANSGALKVDSCEINNFLQLQFAGHRDWTSEVVASTRRVLDAGTACVDAMLQYKSSGRPMCDARVTYMFFGTGDIVVDYTVAPTDAFRGNLAPQLVVNLPQSESDSLVWFGLDRESCFSQRSNGIPGIYAEPRTKLNGVKRQQVRWCAVQKEPGNLYVALLNTLFTVNVDDNRLIISPAADSKTFRLHMRDYSQGENPQDFYATEMPVIETGIVDPPLIKSTEARFTQPLAVTISSHTDGVIRYTLDGTEPTETSTPYTGPITLATTTMVKARAYGKDGTPSFTATRKFNYDYIVRTTFSQKPNTPFNEGADTLLFDGERSLIDDLQEGWLGFSGGGVTTTVELSKPIDIEFITLRYAHAPELWAFAPKQVTVLLSPDGETYTDTLHVEIPFDPALKDYDNPQVVELKVPVDKKGMGFLKIEALSIGSVPNWHRAKGLNPWLLMDEIEVSESTKKNE